MHLKFEKYQGTGNDFVIIDNRNADFQKQNLALIKHLCDRRFGIGADGIILLEHSKSADFNMLYYNPDGSQSFCGNGSRAAVRFAQSLGIIKEKGQFEAYDGIHQTEIRTDLVRVKMADVQNGRKVANGIFIDTGSPHYVEYVKDLDDYPVVENGRNLRYSTLFEPNGSNINFVEQTGENQIKVRTYERGVEAETLSCGTGVTAAAVTTSPSLGNDVAISTLGGKLRVTFNRSDVGFSNIWLEGPAEKAFSGELEF